MGLLIHLVEHLEGLIQMLFEVAAHEGEDLQDDGVADRVEDLISGFAIDDDLLGAQDREVLGDVGLLHAEVFDESSGRDFAVFEQFEDGYTRGVAKGLKDAGFESADGIRHGAPLISEYSTVLI